MRQMYLALVLSGLIYCTVAQEKKRNIGIFNVVKFNNDPCAANNNRNGTCYTAEECEDKGGTSSGSCAEGYGVCCTFTMNCGESRSENTTYFESTKSLTGACNAKICKCNNDICQLRLDFTTFVISGPSTVTLSLGKTTAGVITPGGGKTFSAMTQCQDDQFSVTSPGNRGTPVICGTNSGYHMYVDASDECNVLSFQLSDTATTMREWAIRVTQYSCDYINKAPDGCLQYFFGSNTGTLETFNYAGGLHLANQDQTICIRRESNNCRICYVAASDTDFQVSMKAAMGLIGKSLDCCGWKADGMGVDYDCAIIPLASKKTAMNKLVPMNAGDFCGQKLTDADAGATGVATICSQQLPFQIRFLSDSNETEGEVMDQKGFKINYEQQACPRVVNTPQA